MEVLNLNSMSVLLLSKMYDTYFIYNIKNHCKINTFIVPLRI